MVCDLQERAFQPSLWATGEIMPRKQTDSNFRRRLITNLILDWRRTRREFYLQWAASFADEVAEVDFLNWAVEWTR